MIKFGGSSLATGQHVQVVARMVVEASYDEKVVVVSAPGDTTDQLLDLVSSFEEKMQETDYADILSMGERTSSKVLASALRSMNVQVKLYDPSEDGFPLVTNEDRFAAKVDIDSSRVSSRKNLLPYLKNCVAVVPGFVGRSNGHVTVLGRGGSDVTATVLGNCLDADEVILVKDTAGIMSADPHVVPSAQPVAKLTVDEMYALAQGGASVVMPEALFYKGEGQRLRIVPFGRPLTEDGTEITGSICPTTPSFGRGAGLSEVTVVSEKGPDILGHLFKNMTARVKGIGTSRKTVTLFVEGSTWQEVCRKVHEVEGVTAVSGRGGVGYVDIIHPRLVDQPGVVAKAATLLSLHGINIVEVTSSKEGLTFFLDEKNLDKAYQVLEGNLRVE